MDTRIYHPKISIQQYFDELQKRPPDTLPPFASAVHDEYPGAVALALEARHHGHGRNRKFSQD